MAAADLHLISRTKRAARSGTRAAAALSGTRPEAGPMAAVELRPWRESDAESLLHALLACPDLRKQFGYGNMSTVAKCLQVIRRQLAICLPSTQNFAVSVGGQALGNVGISHIEHRLDTGWMHYWLAPEARGRGLATRAVASVAGWAFREQDLFRLELGHRVNNPASCSVAIRAGFPAEGVERQKVKEGRHRLDVETHARLRTDPPPAVELLPLR